MDKSIQEIYGNRVRTRVCGLYWKGNKILLVNHRGLTEADFWAPPGGGIEFGQSAQINLAREFKEETGLEIQVGNFLFACEFIKSPLHAIELFFDVTATGGNLLTGSDPEMGDGEQIINAVRFFSGAEIGKIPPQRKHGLFAWAKKVEKIRDLTGYLKI